MRYLLFILCFCLLVGCNEEQPLEQPLTNYQKIEALRQRTEELEKDFRDKRETYLLLAEGWLRHASHYKIALREKEAELCFRRADILREDISSFLQELNSYTELLQTLSRRDFTQFNVVKHWKDEALVRCQRQDSLDERLSLSLAPFLLNETLDDELVKRSICFLEERAAIKREALLVIEELLELVFPLYEEAYRIHLTEVAQREAEAKQALEKQKKEQEEKERLRKQKEEELKQARLKQERIAAQVRLSEERARQAELQRQREEWERKKQAEKQQEELRRVEKLKQDLKRQRDYITTLLPLAANLVKESKKLPIPSRNNIEEYTSFLEKVDNFLKKERALLLPVKNELNLTKEWQQLLEVKAFVLQGLQKCREKKSRWEKWAAAEKVRQREAAAAAEKRRREYEKKKRERQEKSPRKPEQRFKELPW